MKRPCSRMFLASLLYCSLVVICVRSQTVSVSSTASHPIPTTLWGQMFEDISHSGDGGLYAELLQNRAFQQVTPGTSSSLSSWSSVGDASIKLIADQNPLSSSLPNSLELSIPTGSSGNVGFSNTGFYGIKVDASWTYNASFFYRFAQESSFSNNITVSLQTSAGNILASSSVSVSGLQTEWTQVVSTLTPKTTATNTDNVFVVTINGTEVRGDNILFSMFSLFPPTFKGRENGMRIDIAETLANMAPSIWRFPGGNNLGQTIASRWQWNNTVGSLIDRPGRIGDWGYINTEYVCRPWFVGIPELCEDLGAEPIMAVWAGFSLGGEIVAEEDMMPYIQQAMDQINFVVGDATESEPAALRASSGHPEPFALTYVEVGNEDFFASDSYVYRWNAMVTTLRSVFPDLHFMATSYTSGPTLSPKPTEYDVHVYQTPRWFANNSMYYDSFARDGTHYFEGEYASTADNSGIALTYPTMEGSTGEASFMTGLERNSDIVFAASYAPLLNNIANSQWTPNLISFDAGEVYPSTSYYVQKLFSLNCGNEYIPSTIPPVTGNVFWSVVRNTSVTPNELIFKVSNTVSAASNLTFVTPFKTLATTGSVQLLTGSQSASNSPSTPEAVTPQESTITTGSTFSYVAPGFSVSILTIAL